MILITGGMGFIGLHTARRLLDAGETVVLTQFHARREPAFLSDEIGRRVAVESLDVSDGGAVLDLVQRRRVTGIVHLAAPGLNALSPGDDYRVNMLGLLNVLEAAHRAEIKRLTLASSIAVYAGLPAGPFQENALLPLASANPTEAFKKAWEILALHYAGRSGLDVICMRIAGIYGPLYHSMANLPSRLCHAAVRGHEAEFVGVRGGAPYADDASDLCCVQDCARAIQLLQMGGRLEHRVYNIGGGRAVTNSELAAAVRQVVPDARISLQPGNGPAARPRAFLDLERIGRDTGYQPAYDITQGVADYVGWLRRNPE